MSRSGRHGARRLVMQALYQHLIAGTSADELQSEFASAPGFAQVDQAHFGMLISQVLDDPASLDEAIETAAERRAGLLDPVERAILWSGTAELRHCTDVPRKVVLNEAIRLAKEFGAAQSYRFVNAVLDRIAVSERGNAA